MEINSNEYISYNIFSGMKSSTSWKWKRHCAKNVFEFRDISNTRNIQFVIIYDRIISVILHLFIICYDQWSVLEIPTGPPVRVQQLWRRTGRFLLIFLQFYIYDMYDLIFKAYGLTTFLTEFQTLPMMSSSFFKKETFHHNGSTSFR